ncbi:MAG: DUF2442 domain-containing protein [Acidithiobacillus ferrooxidans]
MSASQTYRSPRTRCPCGSWMGAAYRSPLNGTPRLAHASAKARAVWEVAGGGYGIHWPEIDEDLSTEDC